MAPRLKDYEMAVAMYEDGYSLAQVAVQHGVSRQSMHDVLKRRTKMRPQLRFGEDNHFWRGGPAQGAERAQNLTEKAIKRGKLIPQPCEICGTTGTMSDGRSSVQAHHDDYNKPLTVRWLCQPHHHEWHQSNRPIQLGTTGGTEPAIAGDIDVICGGFP